MSDLTHPTDGSGLLQAVLLQASQMSQLEDGLERGYAHLGWMILEVYEMQYWRINFGTFREYLKSGVLQTGLRRSPGQLLQYFLTVRDLIDTFNIEQLETIGITKAIKLRAAKEYALVLPAAIRNAALDPKVTASGLKQLISETLKMPEEEGDYMDLEFEFMVSPEQRIFAEKVLDVAMHTEPLTKSTVSKSAQMWNVFEKLGMEFLGAHSGDGQ